MPDVYVEVGTVKGVPNNYLAPAQDGMKGAIIAAVKKTGSGMTTVKPAGGKGIQVNVLVRKLAEEGGHVTCSLFGELFELPSRQRFSPGGSPRGEGKVAGKINAVAGACVGAAVADLMNKIGPAIVGSQAAPAATGTVGSKSPLIFIAPFQVNAKAAPAALVVKAKEAITRMMDKKIRANPKRFTQDSKQFKIGSGMPAYVIGMAVQALEFDAGTRVLMATTRGEVAEHPSGEIRLPGALGRAKLSGMTAPRDADKVDAIVAAAESATDTAIKWILQTHP